IIDGTGKGFRAAVDSANRLKVDAITTSFQHLVAHTSSNAYQVIGTATPIDGNVSIIHIENTDSNDLDMMPMRIRMEILDSSGGSILPNSDNYFSITFGENYISGGSTANSVNTTAGSAKLSSTVVNINGSTLDGIPKEIERCYPDSNGRVSVWETEGILIIPPGHTLNISYTGNQLSGVLYSSVLFIMNKIN
ncbi:MAG: hypothetical protein V3W20_10905, partial [Candidatus Neomarinimicrobiota bacterium]